MYGNEFPHSSGRNGARFGRGFNGADITANEHRNVTVEEVFLPDKCDGLGVVVGQAVFNRGTHRKDWVQTEALWIGDQFGRAVILNDCSLRFAVRLTILKQRRAIVGAHDVCLKGLKVSGANRTFPIQSLLFHLSLRFVRTNRGVAKFTTDRIKSNLGCVEGDGIAAMIGFKTSIRQRLVALEVNFARSFQLDRSGLNLFTRSSNRLQ